MAPAGLAGDVENRGEVDGDAQGVQLLAEGPGALPQSRRG